MHVSHIIFTCILLLCTIASGESDAELQAEIQELQDEQTTDSPYSNNNNYHHLYRVPSLFLLIAILICCCRRGCRSEPKENVQYVRQVDVVQV